jgi:hypothetical protein
MIYQSFVCLVFVHSIFTYHKSYSFFDVKHESIGALALPQFDAELRKGNFLCWPVNIKVHDLVWGPAIRDRPNSSSNELFHNVTASEDSAGEVKCIFAAPGPNCPMVIFRSVRNIQGFDRRGQRMGRSFKSRNLRRVSIDIKPVRAPVVSQVSFAAGRDLNSCDPSSGVLLSGVESTTRIVSFVELPVVDLDNVWHND